MLIKNVLFWKYNSYSVRIIVSEKKEAIQNEEI